VQYNTASVAGTIVQQQREYLGSLLTTVRVHVCTFSAYNYKIPVYADVYY